MKKEKTCLDCENGTTDSTRDKDTISLVDTFIRVPNLDSDFRVTRTIIIQEYTANAICGSLKYDSNEFIKYSGESFSNGTCYENEN